MARLRTLPEALAKAARADAGYLFLSADGGGAAPDAASGTYRSYADMQRLSWQVARALRDARVRRGDLVAIVLADAEQFLTTLFGASMAGVVPASLYPPSTMGELPRYLEQTARILRACSARVVVTSRTLAPSFEAARASCPDLALVLAREDFDGDAPEPAAPAGLATTDADIGVSWLPLNHDMGLIGMALGPLFSARRGVLLPPHVFVKRPGEWLRAISRHRATISFAPNFAYDLCVRRVKDKDLEGLDLSCWSVAGCGAEPIHPPTLAAFAEKFAPAGFRATSFLPCYGLAEHVLAATFPPRHRAPRVEDAFVSCGSPLPGHMLRIVDEEGRPAADGQIGEIALAGPSVMLGYYNDAELTRQTIRDGWLYTGDLGYLSNGELFVCGRVKDVIIVNGRKFHPQDLEWAVDDLAGVRRGRVVAFGTMQRGGPDRIVVVAEPSGTVPSDVLIDAIRRRISDDFGLYVDEVALVPSGTVGRTTSGKVQRAATKARYERGELMETAS